MRYKKEFEETDINSNLLLKLLLLAELFTIGKLINWTVIIGNGAKVGDVGSVWEPISYTEKEYKTVDINLELSFDEVLKYDRTVIKLINSYDEIGNYIKNRDTEYYGIEFMHSEKRKCRNLLRTLLDNEHYNIEVGVVQRVIKYKDII